MIEIFVSILYKSDVKNKFKLSYLTNNTVNTLIKMCNKCEPEKVNYSGRMCVLIAAGAGASPAVATAVGCVVVIVTIAGVVYELVSKTVIFSQLVNQFFFIF